MSKLKLVSVYLCVHDMDRAIGFWEGFLQKKIKNRFEDRWADFGFDEVTISRIQLFQCRDAVFLVKQYLIPGHYLVLLFLMHKWRYPGGAPAASILRGPHGAGELSVRRLRE